MCEFFFQNFERLKSRDAFSAFLHAAEELAHSSDFEKEIGAARERRENNTVLKRYVPHAGVALVSLLLGFDLGWRCKPQMRVYPPARRE